jgi:hypothetical protein
MISKESSYLVSRVNKAWGMRCPEMPKTSLTTADLDVGRFQPFLNAISFAAGGGPQPLAATIPIAQFHNLCAGNQTTPHIPDPQAFG